MESPKQIYISEPLEILSWFLLNEKIKRMFVYINKAFDMIKTLMKSL